MAREAALCIVHADIIAGDIHFAAIESQFPGLIMKMSMVQHFPPDFPAIGQIMGEKLGRRGADKISHRSPVLVEHGLVHPNDPLLGKDLVEQPFLVDPIMPFNGLFQHHDKDTGQGLAEQEIGQVRLVLERFTDLHSVVALIRQERGQPLLQFDTGSDIRMGTIHPEWLAIRCPCHDFAAVMDPDPLARPVTDADIHVVVVRLTGKMILQGLVRSFEVIRMGLRLPGLNADGGQVGQGIADDLRPALVEDDLTRLDIPLPSPNIHAVQVVLQFLDL